MRIAKALSLALLPAVAPFGAQAFTPDRAAIMVDAIRGQGCALSGDDAEAVLAPLGLDSVEVQSFVDTLYGADLVSLSDDDMVLSLSADLCAADAEGSLTLITAAYAAQESDLEPWAPDFDPERGAALIGVVRGLDCAMTTDQAAETLPSLDFDPILTRDIVTVLVETGNATLTPDRQVLTLSDVLCVGQPADDAQAMRAMIDQWIADNPAADATEGEGSE